MACGKKFLVTLDRDEDGVWVVESPSLPGCVTQGAMKDEALIRIREAVVLCFEIRAGRRLPQTSEVCEVEVAV